jgi:cell wall-associated NlpC family hydrolase
MKQHLLFLFLIGLSFTATAAGKKHKSAHRAVHHKKHHDVMARVQVEYTPADKAMADSIGTAASPDQLLTYAQKLIGTPYQFATSNPGYGFDCSGFVGFVFKSFNFDVPRSSCEYINIGEKLALNEAKPGDIILFTGTQTRSRKIGHIGIVMSNDDDGVKFIHATSGKEHGVTISAMDERYQHRFVRIVRLFKQNDTAETLAAVQGTTSQILNK